MRNCLNQYSLCEEEEKPSFFFSYKISPEGDVLSFNVEKKQIAVDIEMTESDVVDVIQEESSLFNYLAEINALSELLYKKMNCGKEFNSFGDKARFDFLFPGQFLMLLNTTLANSIMELGLPLIYSVKTSNEQINNIVEPNYFTSVPTKNKFGRFYARFTSPLREVETLINLNIFNDLVLSDLDKTTYNETFDYYNTLVDGYIRIDDNQEQVRRFK